MKTPDMYLEDTRQPDESRFSDFGFECAKCGKTDLTVDETSDVIAYPHGITRGMVTVTVCNECHYLITKYGWNYENNEECPEEDIPDSIRPDLMDIVKQHKENEEE